jgi:hypothetical protein
MQKEKQILFKNASGLRSLRPGVFGNATGCQGCNTVQEPLFNHSGCIQVSGQELNCRSVLIWPLFFARCNFRGIATAPQPCESVNVRVGAQDFTGAAPTLLRGATASMSNAFRARAEFSPYLVYSPTLQYQHRIVWNKDEKKWDCVKCHRSSDSTHKHEALIALARHDCIPSGVALER